MGAFAASRARRAVLGAALLAAASLAASLAVWPAAAEAGDVLPSWKDTASRRAIVAFVDKVTTPGADFVPEAERIAVFDNDGTLWAEQPMVFQAWFIFDRVRQMAPQHPEWKTEEPFASVIRGDEKKALAGGEAGLIRMSIATLGGSNVGDYERDVTKWLATARHPTTGRPLTEMVYQPMLELLAWLRSKGFRTWMVSGGSLEFLRPWAEKVYGIPPEQVIGSFVKTRFEIADGKPVIRRLAELAFSDDKAGKPVGIQSRIGRHPVIAFGNSDSDLPMLQWTCDGSAQRLCAFVHHTDAKREWKYDRRAVFGRLDKGLDEAAARGWTIVNMEGDWSTVFPPSR